MYDEDLLTQAQRLIYQLNRERWQQKQAAQPPMDPSMMGGAPPMDPMAGGMPPMDPAMAGGMPPMGPPPGGDPAAGGMPPMDPSMMGAAPPMDTAPMGGMAPPAPTTSDPMAAAGDPAKQKMKPEQWMEKLDTRLYNLQVQMAAVMKHLNINVPPESLILPNSKPDVDNPNPTLPDVGSAPAPGGDMGMPPGPGPDVKTGSWNRVTQSDFENFQKMGMSRISAQDTPNSHRQSVIPEDYMELARALGYKG